MHSPKNGSSWVDFLFSFQFVLFTLSVVPNPVSRTPVCGEKQETTRSVGGRSLPGHPCGLFRQTNWYTRFQYIWFCYTDEGYSFIFGLYYNLEIKNTPSVPTVSRHRPTPTLEVTSRKTNHGVCIGTLFISRLRFPYVRRLKDKNAVWNDAIMEGLFFYMVYFLSLVCRLVNIEW